MALQAVYTEHKQSQSSIACLKTLHWMIMNNDNMLSQAAAAEGLHVCKAHTRFLKFESTCSLRT
jgi:hypothetical protein